MPNRGENILVVDDEQNIRLLLRSTLESDGFAVSEAATGEEAINSIEHSKPALVLLDLWMPRSDGMMVLEYLNQKPPRERPRVIVLTANSRVPVVVKAMPCVLMYVRPSGYRMLSLPKNDVGPVIVKPPTSPEIVSSV